MLMIHSINTGNWVLKIRTLLKSHEKHTKNTEIISTVQESPVFWLSLKLWKTLPSVPGWGFRCLWSKLQFMDCKLKSDL